ncbi:MULTISPECIES: Zn-ribbon domain-containing OB-fold protein [Nocardia]|uniref:Zn-ribbon domain-containing OB-fold protein n=1 Tax=Nocardia TaxID=1817 RepID=UPI000D6905DD|nr:MULTISPECIES: OB-fold domain-containing protein [Nocardia]
MTVPLPSLGFENTAFWTGGERGELLIHRCRDCTRWLHPAAPICRYCYSRAIGPEKTRGSGTVYSYTINRQPWLSTLPVPYAIAVIQLDEDPSLRLTTRLVDVAPDAVRIGLRVVVCFEQIEDVWLPLFAPEGATA